MINPDAFYDNIGARMTKIMSGISQEEASRQQHIGKIYNHEFTYSGKMYDTMISNINRLLKGEKKHGFEQNKKTEFDKLVEKGNE